MRISLIVVLFGVLLMAAACSSVATGTGVPSSCCDSGSDPAPDQTPPGAPPAVDAGCSSCGDAGTKDAQTSPPCTAGSKQCNGTTAQQCNGGKWTDETTCSGGTPVCENGLCVACSTGQKECIGTAPRSCVAGQWQYPPVCSGVNPFCLDGICVQCTPGTKQCTGTTPQVCSAAGTWQDQTACSGANPVCLPSSATCVACNTGDKKCTGLDSYTCDAANTWQKAQTCNYVCAGAGVCGVCAPNSIRCDAGTAETCNASGQWYNATSMVSGGGTSPCSAVCSGDPRYTVNDVANTVADSTTGLTWQRNAKYVSPGYVNYANAVGLCTAKGAGWRLPTMPEAQALKPSDASCQFFDEAAFPGVTYNYAGLWTSSTSVAGSHLLALANSYALDSALVNVMCVK